MVQLPDLKLEIDGVGGESDEMELSNPRESGVNTLDSTKLYLEIELSLHI